MISIVLGIRVQRYFPWPTAQRISLPVEMVFVSTLMIGILFCLNYPHINKHHVWFFSTTILDATVSLTVLTWVTSLIASSSTQASLTSPSLLRHPSLASKTNHWGRTKLSSAFLRILSEFWILMKYRESFMFSFFCISLGLTQGMYNMSFSPHRSSSSCGNLQG